MLAVAIGKHVEPDVVRCGGESAALSPGLLGHPRCRALDLEDGIATITLNRPDKLNAFTPKMMAELIAAFDHTDADDAVRAVIVTGAGRAFCAGADLSAGAATFDYDRNTTPERAANRVSASKLREVARALNTSISYFYEGLGKPEESTTFNLPREEVHDFLLTPEGIELANAFPKIPRGRVRRKILDLVRAMAEESETADA